MQICVLSDSDLKEFDPSQYLRAYTWGMFIPQSPVIDFIRRFADENHFDVYFNLCDGAEDEQEDYSGFDIVSALEELQLPFTGADSGFYDPWRAILNKSGCV